MESTAAGCSVALSGHAVDLGSNVSCQRVCWTAVKLLYTDIETVEQRASGFLQVCCLAGNISLHIQSAKHIPSFVSSLLVPPTDVDATRAIPLLHVSVTT